MTEEMFSAIGANLTRLMQEKNTNANALSSASGVPQPTIFKIVRGKTLNPTMKTIEKLADALGVSYTVLTGTAEDENVVPYVKRSKKIHSVPLISWVQAGNFTDVQILSSDDYEWYMCPINISERSYCLRVRGESMEPKFSDGDIVFVDADRCASDGDIVIAQDTDFDETSATMKKLVCDGKHKYLQPLNPNWPGPKFIPCTENTRIVGVVIGKFVET